MKLRETEKEEDRKKMKMKERESTNERHRERRERGERENERMEKMIGRWSIMERPGCGRWIIDFLAAVNRTLL